MKTFALPFSSSNTIAHNFPTKLSSLCNKKPCAIQNDISRNIFLSITEPNLTKRARVFSYNITRLLCI